MFDPLFNVSWFYENFVDWVALTLAVLTFLGSFSYWIYTFVEDDGVFELPIAVFSTVVVPVIVGFGTFGILVIAVPLLAYGWLPLSIMATAIGMAFIARSVRRLQKAMKQHVNNKTAHKGDDHV